MKLRKDILLSDLTTVGLGGTASEFIDCKDEVSIMSALDYANDQKIRTVIFSGGSNIIFPDNGFQGLVIKINNKGVKTYSDEKYFYAEVNAGENWDDFVNSTVEAGYSGIECLSGIPGSAGATPVQNVGAYGQEVKDTILSVSAIDRKTLKKVTFDNDRCGFGYRTSRFKKEDKDKYIIVKVLFRFEKDRQPVIKYSELQKLLESKNEYSKMSSISGKLKLIRDNVISIRSTKSMVIDPNDPNSRSCGSFFTNPVLNESEFEVLKNRLNGINDMPAYRSGNDYKIPAAWLVEQAGFVKGLRKGGVGISSNHSLALININGTTDELLSFASDIERSVFEKFRVKLEIEPVVIK